MTVYDLSSQWMDLRDWRFEIQNPGGRPWEGTPKLCSASIHFIFSSSFLKKPTSIEYAKSSLKLADASERCVFSFRKTLPWRWLHLVVSGPSIDSTQPHVRAMYSLTSLTRYYPTQRAKAALFALAAACEQRSSASHKTTYLGSESKMHHKPKFQGPTKVPGAVIVAA